MKPGTEVYVLMRDAEPLTIHERYQNAAEAMADYDPQDQAHMRVAVARYAY